MEKRHYSWVICIGCTLFLFCSIGLMASSFSVYLPYMIDHSGMSKTEASLIITVRSLLSFFSTMLFVEIFYRQLNIRLGMTLATFFGVGAMVVYGLSSSFTGYCVAAILAGMAHGIGGMIPVSIIINRWFHSQKGLALGICASGSGLASIVSPPIVTAMVESLSLQTAFFLEAAFIAVCAVFVFVVLRNRPEDINLTPLSYEDEPVIEQEINREHQAGRQTILFMMIASFLIGITSNASNQHLPLLYSTEGFDSLVISAILSFSGIALTIGKLTFGRSADRWGSYRTSVSFFAIFTVGLAVCCLAGTGSVISGFASAMLVGLGLSVCTVGIAIFAKDMSTTSNYPKIYRNFQTAFMFGSLTFGPFPGVIADITGSYVLAYAVLSVLSAISMVIVLRSYRHEMAVSETASGIQ